ncbi:MAG: SDR family oxidoreductase [Planctomycetes bacterium]|nr:SDR family oxidoreductase [Planctomycetota bacterium]
MSSASFLQGLFGLDGQVAVVIGGTGVLCGAQARGLAAAGARVVVAGRDAERGNAVVDAIRLAGGSATFHTVDVAERDSVETLCAAVVAQHGRVDMLINGAGINFASSYDELPEADWSRVLRIDLDGVHHGCQVFARQMSCQPDGGAILNIGSVTAHTPLSRVIAYSAAKAAVVNLTRNLARELASARVRVNALCPGFFPAEQNRAILAPERVEKILAGTPLGRFGEPDELVGATLLLLSRSAGSFITGAIYYVDGGFTAMRL